MIRNIIVISILALFTFSCSKSEKCSYSAVETSAPIAEVNSLKSFLQSNAIPFTQDSHGFFYNISNPGSGAIVANLCSKITVSYVGKLRNGTIFDQTQGAATAVFELGQVIYGWQKGIPYVAKGGRIQLYIPPSLGYGNRDIKDGNGIIVIPANSDLLFDITVVDIN